MINQPWLSLIYRPSIMREFAAKRSEFAAVAVNAGSGALIVLAAALIMPPFFTVSLVVLMSILFGPFVGFVISSTYSRIEWAVGKRMGGKASFDDIYRTFAWSFLLLAFAGLFYSLILLVLKSANFATSLVVAIPSLVFAVLTLRNYYLNIIEIQPFTRKRGALSIFITFILFLMVIFGGLAVLSLLEKCGTGEILKSIF